MTKNKDRIDIVKAVALTLIVAFVFFAIWLLLNRSETRISEKVVDIASTSLECETSSSENAFFKSDSAQRVTHKVIAAFLDNKLDKISYEFEGTYNSEDTARGAEAALRANYNLHFRDTGINPQLYSPSIAVIKSKVKILLYSEVKNFNYVVMPIFFLDKDDVASLEEYSRENFKKLFEEKGLICAVYE